MLDFLSIGVFIDGGYYAKMNRALKARERSIIRVNSLFEYITSELAMQEGLNISDCQITEAHYFRGRFRVKEAYDKHLLYNERKFEDTLIENDVVFHYKHLRKFDYVVLITGDADHQMLVRKLKALKIKTVLLTWNLGEAENTSSMLRDEVGQHWDLGLIVENNPQLRKMLLYRLREPAVSPLGDNF